MPFITYILQSQKSGRLYIGQCSDLAARLHRHNAGSVLSTRQGRPWYLIFSEYYDTRAKAVRRERYLKSLKSPKYILQHIVRKAGP